MGKSASRTRRTSKNGIPSPLEQHLKVTARQALKSYLRYKFGVPGDLMVATLAIFAEIGKAPMKFEDFVIGKPVALDYRNIT